MSERSVPEPDSCVPVVRNASEFIKTFDVKSPGASGACVCKAKDWLDVAVQVNVYTYGFSRFETRPPYFKSLVQI